VGATVIIGVGEALGKGVGEEPAQATTRTRTANRLKTDKARFLGDRNKIFFTISAPALKTTFARKI
jgi:hypothetical protein